MAFFQLNQSAQLFHYPYDYHSHLSGILPVRSKHAPSLVGWLDPRDEDEGELQLFEHALGYMMSAGNPFTLLMSRPEITAYERGEVTAENIYIACVLLAQGLRPGDGTDVLPATDLRLYQRVRESLRAAARLDEPPAWLMPLLRYFNDKIYSTNKYTPFDDAYKTRSVLLDRVRGAPTGGEAKFVAWIDATLRYLLQEGVKRSQIPAGRDDIPTLDARMQLFNRQHGTEYRALVHTPNAYAGAEALTRDLERMLPQFVSGDLPLTIGLDILGVENRVADYQALFRFLGNVRGQIRAAYGDGGVKSSASFIVHIHCGEGASASNDNRSMIGYYISSRRRAPDADFWKSMADYIAQCAATTKERQSALNSGPSGARKRKPKDISGLFDELFQFNSLTIDSCQLRRFEITSERSRSLVNYNGKRSVMALCESFDSSSTHDPEGLSWYRALNGVTDPYVFRLGHDYYFRSYVASKFPLLAFDTNLGSNAITGAAGFFGSVESYRINRGFRHLDGYIDTDVLPEVSAAVAWLSSDALPADQIQFYVTTSQLPGTLEAILDDDEVAQSITAFLLDALGPVGTVEGDAAEFYNVYKALVLDAAGGSTSLSARYQAMTRVQGVYRNWRSYLLGADGQGVEHTSIGNEFLRMVLLLTYSLLPVGQTDIPAQMIDTLQRLLLVIASRYWQATVGSPLEPFAASPYHLATLEGFQGPSSVITLNRTKVG